jgi:hypothetical protein
MALLHVPGEELESVGTAVGYVYPVALGRSGPDRLQAGRPQQAFPISALAFGFNAFLAADMVAAVQDLVRQTDHLVPLGVESQAVVAQVATIETTADGPQIGDGTQPRIIQLGGVVQHQDQAFALPHLLQRPLTVRLQHGRVRDLGPVHQAVHGLVVLGIVQLGRQRAAGVPVNAVGDPHQALGPPPMSQSRLAKMGLAEGRAGRGHDCPPRKSLEPHHHFQDFREVKGPRARAPARAKITIAQSPPLHRASPQSLARLPAPAAPGHAWKI